MAFLNPVVILMREFAFQPLFCIMWMRRSYLVCLCVRLGHGLLRQYVNSMSWVVNVGEGPVLLVFVYRTRMPIWHSSAE